MNGKFHILLCLLKSYASKRRKIDVPVGLNTKVALKEGSKGNLGFLYLVFSKEGLKGNLGFLYLKVCLIAYGFCCKTLYKSGVLRSIFMFESKVCPRC